MAIHEDLHVLQNDDHAVRFTVKRARVPFDLTGWTAVFQVAATSSSTPPLVSYDTDSPTPHIWIDEDQDGEGRGGISVVFLAADLATATPHTTPKWYRLRILHASIAPSGRTVRYGNFYIDDT